MGVFGAGIFADDDALDVRGEYKHFLADTQSDALATDAIASQYGASFDDLAATTSFWLALAWTQWSMGRLDPRVKSAALRIIDDGLDLKKWDGSPLRPKRAVALTQARKKIEAQQPRARPLPKPLPVQLPGWEFGELVGVRVPVGKLALLHMIAYRQSSRYGVRAPVVSILNWFDEELPTAGELATLTYINWRGRTCGNHLYSLASPQRSPLSPARFIHLGLSKAVTRGEGVSAYGGIGIGETLDELIAEVLKPYWDNPSLPPHHPGFDKPEARMFKQRM
jgi:hypothetical protein